MPSIQSHEVHVWQANLANKSTDAFLPSLSPDEKARADRFKFPIHRDRFITARGILRMLLANYLNQSPDQLAFCYGDRGKPALAKGELQFNVSHSEDFALYALSCDRAVGIDVEKIRAIDNLEGLTSRFFTLGEHQAIVQLPMEQREKMFFRYWTCKEAYLKATGEGLSQLAGLEISLKDSAQLKTISTPQTEIQNWVLQELELPPEFVGAIAIHAEAKPIELTRFCVEEYCNTAQ